MADSSLNPGRGADLNKLKAQLAELNKKYEAVLANLNEDATTVIDRTKQAEAALEREAVAAERTAKARDVRAKSAEAAAGANTRAATAAEKIAAAELRAAEAAQRRAAAETDAALAAQRAAEAAVAASRAPRLLEASSARFHSSLVTGTEDVYRAPPPVRQIPERAVYGGTAYDARRAAELEDAARARVSAQPRGAPTGATPDHVAALRAAGEQERNAAAATERHAAATAAADAETRAYITGVRGETAALAGLNAEFELNAQRLGLTSNAYQRNGYLTSEFINAAAKGRVTLRELGTQVGGTIAKFAGWTAAASAVYGAARAIGQLGHGAIDAQGGVQNLARSIPNLNEGKALSGFTSLSKELNVGISDVAQAQQGFARVFRNQDDSLIGARTALTAFKLDQISVADSTKFFTAVIQEFGLKAKDLPLILDQISAAQRRIGSRAAETLPALAKSTAAVKNAGGDLTQLIGLIATAQVSTGQTGNVIGTALARSAANFARSPSSAKIFEKYGLDPAEASTAYTQFLLEAVKRSRTLSGAARNELSKAIFGPLRGALLQPLLSSYSRVQLGQQIVLPTNARGSAKEELADVLKRANEQISAIGHSLQRLGVALERSGVLNGVLLIVKGFTTLLNLTGGLIDKIGQLAGPFAGFLAPVLEAVVAFKALQHFGIARSPNATYNQQVLKGGESVRGELNRTYTSNLQRSDTLITRSNALKKQAQLLEAEVGRTEDLEAQRALAVDLDKVNKKQAAIAAEAVAASEVAVSAQEEIAALEARIALFKRLQIGGLSAQEAAVKSGLLYAEPLGTNTAGNPIPVGKGTAAPLVAAPGGKVAPALTAAELDAESKAQAILAAEQTKVASASQRLGYTGKLLGVSAKSAEGGLKAARAGLLAAGKGIIGVFAGLSALDVILGVFIGGSLLTAHEDTDYSKFTAALKTANLTNPGKGGKDIADLRKRAADVRERYKGQGFVEDALSKYYEGQANALADVLAPRQAKGELLTVNQVQANLKKRLADSKTDAERYAAYQKAIDESNAGLAENAKKVFPATPKTPTTVIGPGGIPVRAQIPKAPTHTYGDIHFGGAESIRAGEDQRAIYRAEQDALNQRTARNRFPVDRLPLLAPTGAAGKDTPTLGTYAAQTATELDVNGLSQKVKERLAAQSHALQSALKRDLGPKAIAELQKDIGTEAQTVQQLVNQYVAAHPRSDPRAAARVQIRGLDLAKRATGYEGLKRRIADAKKTRQDAEAALNRDQAELARATAAAAGGGLTQRSRVDIVGGLSALLKRVQKDKGDVAKAKGLAGTLERFLQSIFGTLAQSSREAKQAADLAHYDIVTALKEAQAGGGLAGDKIKALRDANVLNKRGKKGSDAYDQALTENLNTKTSIADQEKQNAADALSKQQAAAQAAQEAADKAREQAKALITAQADLASSKTTDPVKLAKIQLTEAQKLAKYAQGKPEGIEAQAEINNRRRDVKTATQEGKLADIEFYASIGRLSKEAEIAQLEALRKRIKGNKTLRRQITQELYNLKHDSQNADSFELSLGDIKIPTAYEIRRAVSGAKAGINVTNSYATTIHVTSEAGANAVGAQMDRYAAGTSKSIARAMGVR